MVPVKYFKLLRAFLLAYWILIIQFPRLSKLQKLQAIQSWSRQTLTVLGVRLDIAPSVEHLLRTEMPVLYVSNHVSWVDALIIQAVQPSVFVAKDEVRGWPVLGAIASKCGVIFVKRSSITSTRQMVNEVVRALSNDFCVAGFPEGTTSIGLEVNPFYSNLFEASILADAQVLPIALRYTRAATGEPCTKTPFIGELSFIRSLHQVISSNGIVATVLTGQPISPIGHTRKTLAQLSQHAVSTQLATLNSQ